VCTDISKEKAIKDVIVEESTIVGWFSNHQFPLAKLRETTLSMLGSACELIKAGATRFGTHTLVGERLPSRQLPGHPDSLIRRLLTA